MKTCICIVVYNKKAHESVTINHLIDSYILNDTDYLAVVINNGPLSIAGETFLDSNKITLLECLDNKPLSHIYNNLFVSFPAFDRYVILDDDTPIGIEFFNDIDKNYYDGIDLQIPIILDSDGERRYYPLINKKVFQGQPPILINPDVSILSIGSGLVIYNSLLRKFKSVEEKLFDMRYALYGVDFSLFRRVEKLKASGVLVNIQISSTIKHSLSRVDGDYSEWRQRERVYDYALSVRFYSKSKIHFVCGLLKFSAKELVKLRFKNIFLLLKTLLDGKHPRC